MYGKLSFFKKNKPLINEVFGSLRFWTDTWTADHKIPLQLWGRSYELSLAVKDNPDIKGVSKLQENIYLRFTENIVENQHLIEQEVSRFFNTADTDSLVSKFIPYEIIITSRGECAVIAENTEDDDMNDINPGLAVVIYPKCAIFAADEFEEYAFFGTDYGMGIKKKLWDE